MDFLNKLGQKASETYQVTKKFSEELKLKGKINEKKSAITALYREMGEIVYQGYKENSDENTVKITELCEKISKNYDEIAKLETEILNLKEVKKCVDCGSEINKKDAYCSKCGKEQPMQAENVEVKEESEIQDVQDAEVTEIKDSEEE